RAGRTGQGQPAVADDAGDLDEPRAHGIGGTSRSRHPAHAQRHGPALRPTPRPGADPTSRAGASGPRHAQAPTQRHEPGIRPCHARTPTQRHGPGIRPMPGPGADPTSGPAHPTHATSRRRPNVTVPAHPAHATPRRRPNVTGRRIRPTPRPGVDPTSRARRSGPPHAQALTQRALATDARHDPRGRGPCAPSGRRRLRNDGRLAKRPMNVCPRPPYPPRPSNLELTIHPIRPRDDNVRRGPATSARIHD
ncbi:MAG: hypothetical protein JWO52_2639, partial [Gammaproteobacteria bacterium]|nr:hypothetical protein [Gammaproteobacteria bacterium]